tara:strand:- start:13803 stop:14147 length:345 start_codon:yes stop_codon:yes gene_type:complete
LKKLLLIGIILLVLGIVLKKLSHLEVIGLILIITGVAFKAIYILLKIKNGEYKPRKELLFLLVGLVFFFTGLYLQKVDQSLIDPIYFIVFGLVLKVIFIIRFIKKIRPSKNQNS